MRRQVEVKSLDRSLSLRCWAGVEPSEHGRTTEEARADHGETTNLSISWVEAVLKLF